MVSRGGSRLRRTQAAGLRQALEGGRNRAEFQRAGGLVVVPMLQEGQKALQPLHSEIHKSPVEDVTLGWGGTRRAIPLRRQVFAKKRWKPVAQFSTPEQALSKTKHLDRERNSHKESRA